MVRDGKFREDLYHRLNVIQIKTTPLRDRAADIADLAKLFVLQIGGANCKISSRAIQALKDYDWPGNVRELRNAVERAVIFARKNKREEIDFEDIMIYRPKEDVLYRMRKIQASLPTNLLEITPTRHLEYLEALEREYFKTALELANGQVLEVVSRIGLSRSTVFKRLKDLGINQAPAKPSEVSSKQNFINMNQEVELGI
jgi:DNA-binding NtrC family response regulator